MSPCLVIVTWSAFEPHRPLLIVQVHVTVVPFISPLSAEVLLVGSASVPASQVHKPFPIVGTFPAKFTVLAQVMIFAPASGVSGSA